MYSSTLSLTSALDRVGGQGHAPTALPPGNTRYQLYKRLGGFKARYGRVQKISAGPGFDPRTVQAVASRYTEWDIVAHLHYLRLTIKLDSQDADPVRRIRNLVEEMFRTSSEFLIYSTFTEFGVWYYVINVTGTVNKKQISLGYLKICRSIWYLFDRASLIQIM